MLLIIGFSNCAYAIVAPFLPFELERQGISQAYMGYVFASYSIAVIFLSPLFGAYIHIIKRTRLILIGILAMGISFFLLGLSDKINHNVPLFISVTLFARFI
jgi:MFS family permease